MLDMYDYIYADLSVCVHICMCIYVCKYENMYVCTHVLRNVRMCSTFTPERTHTQNTHTHTQKHTCTQVLTENSLDT